MSATFITGASGFVGLALTEHLLGQGDTVIGFDRSAVPAAALARFAALPGRFVAERGDVQDIDALQAAWRRHRPGRLVSLAAVTAGPAREAADPASIAQVNVAGAWSAITVAARGGAQRIVHVSSGSVYGDRGRQAGPLDETVTPLAPEGLYGITKQAAEAGALRLAGLLGVDLVVARLGTCFGPWEADTGVRDTLSAPLQILRCAEQGLPAVLARDSRRDWLYVRDGAAGLAALLATPALPERIYHVAAGFTWPLSQWCERMRQAFPGFTWHVAAPDGPEGPGCAASPSGASPAPQHAGTRVTPVDIALHAPYDRAAMRWERLARDTGFVPRFDLHAAATDHLAWRAAQAALPS